MASTKQDLKNRDWGGARIRFVLGLAILLGINVLATRFHWGIDLTREKRFTITGPTRNLLSNLEDAVVVEVYLKGSFPAGFQRLSEATRETLETFRSYAGAQLSYRFIDPFQEKGEEDRQRMVEYLSEKGIHPVNLQVQGDEEGYSEKLIFPYALVRYQGKEIAVRLLERKPGLTALQQLHYAESLLEYKLARAVRHLQFPAKPEIAYIVGHGEALGVHTHDLLSTLETQYKVDTFDLPGSLYIPSYYKAIIINGPSQPFDEKDKFKIDQYIMRGGKVLWALEALEASMDSLVNSPQFIAMPRELNLDDQLFRYGIRINASLVEDMQCLPIPVTVGMIGNRPDIQLRNWLYFPVITPRGDHPIVKNMGAVTGMFMSPMDTVKAPGIEKTILLQSSKYSRLAPAPARVSLSMLKYPVREDLFRQPDNPVAVLLEGRFSSIFLNRLSGDFLRTLKDSLNMPFKHMADSATSMIVISDADMLLNDFSQSKGIMEMGYWDYTREWFSNKAFVLNCLEYLTDDSGLLIARSKENRLRLLDGARVKAEKNRWQWINLGVPVAIVLVFASVYLFFRQRKYGHNSRNRSSQRNKDDE